MAFIRTSGANTGAPDYNTSTLVADMGFGGTANTVTVNKGLYSWFCETAAGANLQVMKPTVSSGGKYVSAYEVAAKGVTGIIIVDQDNTTITMGANTLSAHLYKFEE